MTPLMEITKTAKQPEGGFLPAYCLEQIHGAPDKDLHPFYLENLPPRFASTLVDSISKFLAGAPLETAFHRTIAGAEMAEEYYPDSVKKDKRKRRKRFPDQRYPVGVPGLQVQAELPAYPPDAHVLYHGQTFPKPSV